MPVPMTGAKVRPRAAGKRLPHSPEDRMMKPHRILLRGAALVAVATLSHNCAAQSPSPNVHVVASGLNGPRGLRFGPDGLLYVAEAGTGGTNFTTADQCTQVPGPIGPYGGGNTGRISRIDKAGNRTTIADGLPSAVSSNPTKDTMGVSDVAFLNGQLYAVTAAGGCSHGNPDTPNAIYRVNIHNGSFTMIADLSEFLQTHQAMYENAADFEPDGVFYSLTASDGDLYTVEPNHGQIFRITPWGDITEVMDVSKAEGHIVPTSVAIRKGEIFVGNLGTFPVTPNASKIITLAPGCRGERTPGLDNCDNFSSLGVVGSRAGFATVVAVDFGPDGLLYALELSPQAGYPTPGVGDVVRINRNGQIQQVATGLVVPTGMTFGPDGKLYVSNAGAAPPGAGSIVKIDIPK